LIQILIDNAFTWTVNYYVFSLPKWIILALRVYYILESYSGGVD